MEVYIHEQLLCILYSVVLGVFFGLIYDALKFARNILNNTITINRLKTALYDKKYPFLDEIKEKNKKVSHKVYKIKLFFYDLLFFLIITPITQVFIYATSFGIVRWYIFISIGFGFFVYHFTLSKLIKYMYEPIIYLFILLKEYFKLPFKKLIKFIKNRIRNKRHKRIMKIKKTSEVKKENRTELIFYGVKK